MYIKIYFIKNFMQLHQYFKFINNGDIFIKNICHTKIKNSILHSKRDTSLLKICLSIAMIILINIKFYAQTTCYDNASFEGTSMPHQVPSPWNTCWGTPDTQPGQWGISLPASDGNTYISCLLLNNYEYVEGTTQPLDSCMIAGETYTFNIDLAFSNIYMTASPDECYGSFAVWGGNSACHRGELLYCSGEIWNTNWQTYTITFTPTQNWCYIGFSPCYIHDCNGYINIMMDNISCIQPLPPELSIDVTDILCNGDCNGAVTANVSSGTPPFSFIWSNGCTTQTCNNLCAGTYSVTVTDSEGEQTTASASINEPAILTTNVTSQNVSCNGGNNGNAQISVTGGTTPYTYIWSNGQTTDIANNLVAGTYTVTVTDANNCTATNQVTINQPDILIANINLVQNPLCYNDSNGIANATVTGGVPPYSYNWVWNNHNSNLANVNNLPGGELIVLTVTDNYGCQSIDSIILINPQLLTCTIDTFGNEICTNGNNGFAMVEINGGTQPYSIIWLPINQTGTFVNGLSAGTYTVNVTDANNCTCETDIIISNIPNPTIEYNISNDSCHKCIGKIHINGNSGTPPYTYYFGNISDTNPLNINNLCEGTYNIKITDSNNCSVEESVNIINYGGIEGYFSAKPQVTDIYNPEVHFYGYTEGSSPAIYYWDFGDGSIDIGQTVIHTFTESGNYTISLIVEDNFGCRDTAIDQVIIENISTYYLPNVITPNEDGINDVFYFSATNIDPNSYELRIYDRWGKEIFYTKDINVGWDGKYNGKVVKQDVYNYLIYFLDKENFILHKVYGKILVYF